MRKQPIPEQFTAIVDTREKRVLDLSPLKVETGTLTTGDYSIKGLEHVIAVERKSLEDYVMCCGRERERFDRECQRLLAYPVRAIVVEASMADLEMGAWRGKMTPKSVCGSTAGFVAMGLPVYLVGNHRSAGEQVARILFHGARRRYQENLNFMESL